MQVGDPRILGSKACNWLSISSPYWGCMLRKFCSALLAPPLLDDRPGS